MSADLDGAWLCADRLVQALDALWAPDTQIGLDDLVGLLIRLQDLQKELAVAVSSCEETILNLMPDKTAKTVHGQIERVTSASKTTWDAPLLLAALAREANDQRAVDPETAEMEDPVAAITRALTECCAVSYFRLGALEQYGIDGRKYREVEWGRKRVKVTRSTPSQAP